MYIVQQVLSSPVLQSFCFPTEKRRPTELMLDVVNPPFSEAHAFGFYNQKLDAVLQRLETAACTSTSCHFRQKVE